MLQKDDKEKWNLYTLFQEINDITIRSICAVKEMPSHTIIDSQ